MIRRRTFLALSAAAAVLPTLPRRVWAGSTLELDGLRLDTLSDGHLTLPPAFTFGDLDPALVEATITRHNLSRDQLTPPCNITLLRDGNRTVLFDVGAGTEFMDSAGRLPEALDLLGIAPGDVTDVVITHGHPDHLWGLLDDFDEPVFANADYHMGGAELDYWTDPATVASIGEERASMAVGAARRLAAISDRITRIADGDVILGQIKARLTPGHTPGHLSFEIGRTERVMVLGDAVGNHHIAFDAPDLPQPSDQDPPLAAATRSALLAELAESRMPVIGFHLPEGGIGHVEAENGAYRFVPAKA